MGITTQLVAVGGNNIVKTCADTLTLSHGGAAVRLKGSIRTKAETLTLGTGIGSAIGSKTKNAYNPSPKPRRIYD